MPLSVVRSSTLGGTLAGPKSKSAIYTYTLPDKGVLVKIPPSEHCWFNQKCYNINEGGEFFLEAEELGRLAVEAATEKQASDIVMLDVRGLCSFADYFVICSGESDRQIEAIWRGIHEVLRSKGVTPHHKEGTADSGWLLGDFETVIVHIFGSAERDYYQLDKLWNKAIPTVRIQ